MSNRRLSTNGHSVRGSLFDVSPAGKWNQDDEVGAVPPEDLLEEGREYLQICDHNLHSVMSNPRVSLCQGLNSMYFCYNLILCWTIVNMGWKSI